MIGAILDDRLVGARLDNPGYWNKARQCLPEQGSTAPRSRLDWYDRSSAQRSPEQGSTGMIGAMLDDRLVGARLDQGHWSKARQSLLEQGSTAPGALLDRDD